MLRIIFFIFGSYEPLKSFVSCVYLKNTNTQKKKTNKQYYNGIQHCPFNVPSDWQTLLQYHLTNVADAAVLLLTDRKICIYF